MDVQTETHPGPPGSRVAVIGSGIAGLASAYLLARRHRVTLYEAAAYAGGHTNTVDVELDGLTHPVDTGFLVFNDRTYPNLIALFDELDVASYESDMTFSVSLDHGRLEWAGTNLNTVFAQRHNLLSPSFLGMLRDIVRFSSTAERHLEAASASGYSVGDLLTAGRYGDPFRQNYLLPMAAAIWSCASSDVLRFPAATFLRFCLNHALLQVNRRPRWKTVAGGAREYVRRIVATLDDVRTNERVVAVRRERGGVHVASESGCECFDAAILATHAPDSLRMLADPDPDERHVLGAIRYQPNVAWLHTDLALLPRSERIWSAWNYLSTHGVDGMRPVCVSYLINRLQPLPFKRPVIVTLNPSRPPSPETVLKRFDYDHPLLDSAAVAAQSRLPSIQRARRTWFAGAWTGYGFHEDGLKSALRIARDFGVEPSWSVR
ncbi:NAD(P)/FAD-dependent oxidoreductase [Paraburkholderia hospita]|uniref:FAD dependent oxidoreductase n=1 Tax=Paraburkholderia hospita TaxID=169430 RepID=A0AAN1ML76_9BURK|nr:FAD-dependent oxidoreductase [Paraburkholderia hospita]AUT71186.1 NAD/FAD-binding protein [Paraburkholderia hospita]EIM95527.1 FAD dependent oxidoreductase [Paraburkholderia hospita]OUL69011.1 NAD/FAD-binding protein [Paraburkholderia hospita]OUL90484.1 NAD/FAD-binding protein [Paraburkholderia hospita]SEI21349.1 Predicted NAD/FAD-binding protein [Paraburkholderia hospita]